MTNATFTILEIQDDFGVAYELYQLPSDHRFAARIHVHDTDADEVISNTFYPTMEMARKAYAAEMAIVANV